MRLDYRQKHDGRRLEGVVSGEHDSPMINAWMKKVEWKTHNRESFFGRIDK